MDYKPKMPNFSGRPQFDPTLKVDTQLSSLPALSPAVSANHQSGRSVSRKK